MSTVLLTVGEIARRLDKPLHRVTNGLRLRRIDGPSCLVARISGAGTAAWYLVDRLGSVRQMTDAAGAVQYQVTYGVFGNVASEVNASFADSRKYTGAELDQETGRQYHWMRYYDPTSGRWQTTEPLGIDGHDPSNLYRYVGNSPANSRDRTGLQAVDVDPEKAKKAAAAIAAAKAIIEVGTTEILLGVVTPIVIGAGIGWEAGLFIGGWWWEKDVSHLHLHNLITRGPRVGPMPDRVPVDPKTDPKPKPEPKQRPKPPIDKTDVETQARNFCKGNQALPRGQFYLTFSPLPGMNVGILGLMGRVGFDPEKSRIEVALAHLDEIKGSSKRDATTPSREWVRSEKTDDNGKQILVGYGNNDPLSARPDQAGHVIANQFGGSGDYLMATSFLRVRYRISGDILEVS